MFSRKIRFFWPFLLILALLGGGCRRKEPTANPVVALLPLENLSPGPDAAGIGPAITAIVQYEMKSAAGTRLVATRSIDDAVSAEATALVHGYYMAEGSNIRLRTVIEQLPSHQMRPAVERTFPRAQLAEAATALASSLTTAKLRPFPAARPEAVEAWSQAGSAPDVAEAVKLLERAIAADPGFGLAYLNLLQLKKSTGDKAGVEQVLQAARQSKMADAERAELELLAGGSAAETDADTDKLIARWSSDPAKLMELANAAYRSRRFAPAARFFRAAAQAAPTNATVWNQLAYACAFAGDTAGAEQSLAKLREANPANPNSYDTAGDIRFLFGDFAKAEASYLEANRKDPKFLGGASVLKAARARLMTGDIAGADPIFARYLALRKELKDPGVGLLQVQWNALTGRKKQALEALPALAADPQTAPGAEVQAAIWSLIAGSTGEAEQHARKALAASAADPAHRTLAALAMFLTQPANTPADWQALAARVFPGPQLEQLRTTAVAYALLLHKQPKAAVPLLEQMMKSQDPAASESDSMLLAGALVDSGSPAAAQPLLRTYPIPQAGGIPVFATLYFPRLFELRAKVLGDAQSLEIYHKLSR